MKPSKPSFFQVWIFYPALLAGLWSLTSCQRDKRPSVLIIAIERLAFNTFSCSDDKEVQPSGLSLLCNEGIRFTHAYTTSPQPAAAVASLLTGVYPLQHRVHRSFDRIDPAVQLLPQFLNSKGYRGYFFGGSPSLLKKTGLSAGFDIFDDSTFLEKKTFALDFKIQTEKFFSAVHDDRSPYFAVIHNAELGSMNAAEGSISQFEKLDEKMFNFFSELKSQKLWDENYIVVVGLQGQSDYSRPGETPFSNLNSENTQVSLFIKPPRVKGDEGVSWKVDTPISIADFGHSLWTTMFGANETTFQNINILQNEFPVFDISAIWLNQNKMFTLPIRRLLIETEDTWSRELQLRFAILFRNLILIENEDDQVFNTLTDGLESIDIANQQKSFVLDNQETLNSIRGRFKVGRWTEFKSELNPVVLTNREYWLKPNSRVELFRTELERLNQKQKPNPLSALLLRHLVQNKKTSDLKNIKIGPLPPNQSHQFKKDHEAYYDYVKLHSINVALENIWGVWREDEAWLYSDLMVEVQ